MYAGASDVYPVQHRYLGRLPLRTFGLPASHDFVFEMPRGNQSQLGWPTNSEEALSLAMGFMNANPTLRRVAFEMQDSWVNGKWPC
jgi:hypothetical protein